MATNEGKDTRTWQRIAAELCKETDPEKALILAQELNLALERLEAARHRPEAESA